MKTLEQLYAFDVGLFEALMAVKAKAAAVRQSHQDPSAVKRAGDEMEAALDDFERTFDKRRQILTAE